MIWTIEVDSKDISSVSKVLEKEGFEVRPHPKNFTITVAGKQIDFVTLKQVITKNSLPAYISKRAPHV